MGSKNIKDINVSIIIVNYNSNHLLNKCLESIFSYTRDIKFEVIVVDNNSTEGGVDELILNYQGIKLIKNNENMGFARANNVGIEYSSGKYILFLNNDTYLTENSLKKVFEFAESVEEEVFIGCKLLNEDGSRQVSLVNFDTITNSFGENLFLYKILPGSKSLNKYYYNYKEFEDPIEVDIIKGAFMFCSESAVRKLNGFDPRFYFFGEESDLCLRFKKQGGKIFYYPGTSIYHVGGATVEKNQWFKFKYQNIAKVKKLQKHYRNPEFMVHILSHYSGLILRIPVYFISGLLLLNRHKLFQSFYYLKLLFIYPKNEFVS